MMKGAVQIQWQNPSEERGNFNPSSRPEAASHFPSGLSRDCTAPRRDQTPLHPTFSSGKAKLATDSSAPLSGGEAKPSRTQPAISDSCTTEGEIPSQRRHLRQDPSWLNPIKAASDGMLHAPLQTFPLS